MQRTGKVALRGWANRGVMHIVCGIKSVRGVTQEQEPCTWYVVLSLFSGGSLKSGNPVHGIWYCLCSEGGHSRAGTLYMVYDTFSVERGVTQEQEPCTWYMVQCLLRGGSLKRAITEHGTHFVASHLELAFTYGIKTHHCLLKWHCQMMVDPHSNQCFFIMPMSNHHQNHIFLFNCISATFIITDHWSSSSSSSPSSPSWHGGWQCS